MLFFALVFFSHSLAFSILWFRILCYGVLDCPLSLSIIFFLFSVDAYRIFWILIAGSFFSLLLFLLAPLLFITMRWLFGFGYYDQSEEKKPIEWRNPRMCIVCVCVCSNVILWSIHDWIFSNEWWWWVTSRCYWGKKKFSNPFIIEIYSYHSFQ